MPPICSLVNDANLAFSPQNIDGVDETLYAPDRRLLEGVSALGSDQERGFLSTYPQDVQDRIRDEIYACLTTSPRTPITFAWIETGAFEVVSVNLSKGRAIIIGGPPH